ncbi:MAG: hypothetical protein Q7T16_03730 [Candidatus Burarchaeum sp.]|nr:hypothetical protein [Candidatus Burarchaeum sp.]MDO8339742.1 hypothetical protein [Candidatus Burarchaeum sp.]
MDSRKGFFVSIVTLALALSLVSFSMGVNSVQNSLDRQMVDGLPAETAAYAFDDVGSDIDSFTGINFGLARNASQINASFGGTIGMQRNMSQEIAVYGTYAADYYARWTGANLSLDLSNLTDGAIEVSLSNGLQFVLSNQSAVFQTVAANGATNVTRYEISVNVDRHRRLATPWIPSGGDIQVVLRYSDRNGSITDTVSLSSTGINNYVIDYSPLDSITISVGQNGGRTGVLSISQGVNVTALVRVNASINYTNADEVQSYYSAFMNYSQGGVERRAFIEGDRV